MNYSICITCVFCLLQIQSQGENLSSCSPIIQHYFVKYCIQSNYLQTMHYISVAFMLIEHIAGSSGMGITNTFLLKHQTY
jgi:hypothetical protein